MVKKEYRLIQFDLLRIFCIFSVVILHVAANQIRNVPVDSYSWHVFNAFDSAVRFAVPVFVMISGVFFLNPQKKISLKDLYRKYIYRIIIAFLIFSVAYGIITTATAYEQFSFGMVKIFIKKIIKGHYHLWYMYLIVGLYMVTPILKKITADKKITEYFLLLCLVFGCIIPFLDDLKILSYLINNIKRLQIYMPVGYIGYYVLGYYIHTYIRISKKSFPILFYLIGAVITAVSTWVASMGNNVISVIFYEEYAPGVLLMSLSVFIFFQQFLQCPNCSDKTYQRIRFLSRHAFTVYLVHVFGIMILNGFGLTTLSFNAILAVPVLSLVVYLFSLLLSVMLSKIPYLKKIL